MHTIDRSDAHEVIPNVGLDFVGLVVLDNFDCKLPFIGLSAVQHHWLFDGGISDGLKLFDDGRDKVILAARADGNILLHDIDGHLCVLMFQELIKGSFDLACTICALDSRNLDGVNFWFW